jgi:hypothetical protein
VLEIAKRDLMEISVMLRAFIDGLEETLFNGEQSRWALSNSIC